MKILFLHGWQSVPGGVKPTYLSDAGHEVINPKLDDNDFEEAVRVAQAEFDEHQPNVIVGSSRGGAVAMNMNSGNAWLVLLCPAWKKWGTASTIKKDTTILHSRQDDVIPFADSEELVVNSGLPSWFVVATGSDHRLADPVSLATMLQACGTDDDDLTTDPYDEVTILAHDWAGLCYTAALRWVLNAEDTDWDLVHGSACSPTDGKRIEHAWCERGNYVLDLTFPAGKQFFERAVYYDVVKPQVAKVYSSDHARLLMIRNMHHGPWDETEQIDLD
jgi:hypothetical protein